MTEHDGVERAWEKLGLPGGPPRDVKDATLYVPVTYGSIRDTGETCPECLAPVMATTVYGVSAVTTFPIGTLAICSCEPDHLNSGSADA